MRDREGCREIKSIRLPHDTLGFALFYISLFFLSISHTHMMIQFGRYTLTSYFTISLANSLDSVLTLGYSVYEYLMMTFTFCFAQVFTACLTESSKRKKNGRDHHLHIQCAKHILQLLWACDVGREKREKPQTFLALCWGNQHHHYHRTLIRNLSRSHSRAVAGAVRRIADTSKFARTHGSEKVSLSLFFSLAVFFKWKNNFRNMELNKCAPRSCLFYFTAMCVRLAALTMRVHNLADIFTWERDE